MSGAHSNRRGTDSSRRGAKSGRHLWTGDRDDHSSDIHTSTRLYPTRTTSPQARLSSASPGLLQQQWPSLTSASSAPTTNTTPATSSSNRVDTDNIAGGAATIISGMSSMSVSGGSSSVISGPPTIAGGAGSGGDGGPPAASTPGNIRILMPPARSGTPPSATIPGEPAPITNRDRYPPESSLKTSQHYHQQDTVPITIATKSSKGSASSQPHPFPAGLGSPVMAVKQAAARKASGATAGSSRCTQASPAKLIDANMTFRPDDLAQYLPKTSKDFHVVGALGFSGVGKSSVLSWLAAADSSSSEVFRIGSGDPPVVGCVTEGVDAFITEHNMLLLDAQAVFAATLMERLVREPDLRPYAGYYSRVHDCVEHYSVLVGAWLARVCDTLLLVTADPLDADLVDLLHAVHCESRLPREQAGGDDNGRDRDPARDIRLVQVVAGNTTLVVVHNRAEDADFLPHRVQARSAALAKAYGGLGNLDVTGGPRTSAFIGGSQAGDGANEVNLVLLPPRDADLDNNNTGHSGATPGQNGASSLITPFLWRPHLGFQHVVENFRRQVLEYKKRPHRSRWATAPGEWLQAAAGAWDDLGKAFDFSPFIWRDTASADDEIVGRLKTAS